MYDNQRHNFCSEFYTIEKYIEVVVNIRGEDTRIRIDALKDGQSGQYSTKAYTEKHVTLQLTYPQTNGCHDQTPNDFRVWVNYDLPWTNRATADMVLDQALGFLREHCSG